MRTRLAVALALAVTLAGALTACSGAENEDAKPEAAPAPEALADAIDAWVDSNTGSFTSYLGEESSFSLAVVGNYVLDEDLVGAGTIMRSDDTMVATEMIRDNTQMWTRVSDDPEKFAGCWMRTAADQMDMMTDTALGVGPSMARLAQLNVVDLAEGTDWEDEGTVVNATTDLYTLVMTLGATWRELDLDPTSRDRADIKFLLADGEIVGWRTDMGSVLAAVRDSGVQITPAMEKLVASGVEVPVTTSFADLGADVTIERPRTKESFDMGVDSVVHERNRKACESRA